MQLPVALMVVARLLAPLRRRERLPLKPAELLPQLDVMGVLRLGVRIVAVASVLVLASVLITNDTRGHQNPDRYPTPQEIRQAAEEYHAQNQG